MTGRPRTKAKREAAAAAAKAAAQGGGVESRIEGGGGTLQAGQLLQEGSQPSRFLVLSDLLPDRGEAAPTPVPVVGSEDPLVCPALLPADTASEWLELNSPKLLAVAARRACSFRDPIFSTTFFKGLLDHQTAGAKAIIAAKGKMGAAALTATMTKSQKALIEVAEAIDDMDPGAAVEALRSLDGGDDGEEG